jgi:hypothetical protein
MVQRLSRSLLRRVRENPLCFSCSLLVLILEGISLWLLFTSWGSSGIDRYKSEVARAVGMLGGTFLVPMIWTMPFRSRLGGFNAENTTASLDRSRVMRPSTRVQRVGFGVWALIFTLALILVVAALSGIKEIAIVSLALIVAVLNLVALIGVVVMRWLLPNRQ